MLHLATDADTGRIVASVLTDKDADDGSQVGPLLDQVDRPVASFTGDGAYDRDDVYAEVAARYPVRPWSYHRARMRCRANRTDRADAARPASPMDRRARPHGLARLRLQLACSREADISRWKRVIGDGLRSQTDGRQATEMAIAADALNRMLDLGRPEYVRIT